MKQKRNKPKVTISRDLYQFILASLDFVDLTPKEKLKLIKITQSQLEGVSEGAAK